MDIIDIMLARAMTPQGQTDTYVAKANAAAAKANKAAEDATAAAETLTSASEDLAAAQELLETLQQMEINTLDTEDVDAEVKKLTVNANVVDGAGAKTIQMVTTYPDNDLNTQNIIKLYKATGSNEDGAMTQKAITDALNNKLESSALNDYASKQYVNNAISNISINTSNSGEVNISFDTDDAGHITAVDENGNLVASNITEDMLINLLLDSNAYTLKDAVGLDMDYANKTYGRIQQAAGLSMGNDFNQFTMYGGRVKCNVNDNGEILAFYGDNNYKEDGSNGQVMIYQPKFYYRRTPQTIEEITSGKIIRHETLILSATRQSGFKLAPIFEGDLDYVLLPAYDGSLNNNKLSSVAGAQPLNNVTVDQAESYAIARGEGWHIMNLAAEATNQMLEIVEFGTMNGQSALGSGITYNPNNGGVCSFITGSTSSLGNNSGSATTTQVIMNGNTVDQTSDGYRAITYRGMENPWGNLWQLIGGANVYGDGSRAGGTVYICNDFNYTSTQVGDNYESVGFNLPGTYKWINAMGMGNNKFDWAFLPIECSQSANSLLPIGDSIWTLNGLNTINILASGGSYGFQEECGPFYYAADRNASETSRSNYGAKLLYIPTKNATYYNNISKWTAHMEG